MTDVGPCLEDFEAGLEQHSRTLQQALDMPRGARNAKVEVQEA
jgi:hypothetical protein